MREGQRRIYHRGTIPGETYPGVDTAVAVAATAHLLVCREDFPRDRAYQLAKALTEHQSEWASRQRGVHQLGLRSAPLGSSLPFHPGALDYYREKYR